ncbi:MAG: hypothetical protein O3B87_04985 [bacterium]|nr:hypothetical protein [bacterium]
MLNKNIILLSGGLLICLAMVLFPHSKLNTASNLLDLLISDSVRNEAINLQHFWKTREFYAPGYITLDKKVHEPNPFLKFKSDTWESNEFLTSDLKLSLTYSEQCIEVLLITDRDLICTIQDGRIFIAFVRGQEEMRQANVFYDPKHDADLIEGKSWLVTSYIL